MMEQNNTSLKETHEGKQRNSILLVLYALVVIGITTYIAFADIWPITFFQDLLLDSNNMYPVKAVFLLTLISVGVTLFPLYWLLKKVVQKKNNSEAIATEIIDGSFERKEFSFTYTAAVHTVLFEKMYMKVKIGFMNKEFLIANLRNFYLLSRNDYQTLYITFDDGTGKVKKLQLNAENPEPQLNMLIEELKLRCPNKSLNHLPQAEALKVLKVMSPALMVTIVLLVILVITALIVYFALK